MPVDLYDPRTMMDALERMAPVHTFIKNTFFTNEETFPSKHVDVDFYKGKRRIAPFVHPKIGGTTVENRGYSTQSYEPPLVAPDKITTADDLMQRTAGEPLYGGLTPAQRAARRIGKDLSELDEMITRREEWMAAQAVFTGKIPVVGEGLDEEIDFNFTNKVTLSGADLWSDPDSDPISDLENWVRQVRQNGFVNPDSCIMAYDAANAFINHSKVRDLLDTRRIEVGAIQPEQLPNGVTYLGRINKLGLDIYQYDEWYLDDWTDPDNPTEKPIVPSGTVAVISTQANFSLLYAAITIVDMDTKQWATVEASRVPDTWVTKKPDRRFVQVSSKPLPVPHEVDSWYVATVL